jgi:uncharacterized protein YndB with AHSA1/START domain
MTSSVIAMSAGESIIRIERIFNAPRALLFRLITDPFHIAHFLGPHGVTNTIFEMDVRPGGFWRHVMRFPDGSECLFTSLFLEVAVPERIVYRDAPHGSRDKLADLPPPLLVTSFLLEDLDGRTRLTAQVQATVAAARELALQFAEGMSQGNEKLAAYLAEP